jgi:hypothetical protein
MAEPSPRFYSIYDPQSWLQSPAIDLKPYAGAFDSSPLLFQHLDEILNKYKGWYIDDLSISAPSPPACSNQAT